MIKNCPMCESENVSIKADKHGPQYFVCNDCGYSESAEHTQDDLDEDDEAPVKPVVTTKKIKSPAKKSTVKRNKK